MAKTNIKYYDDDPYLDEVAETFGRICETVAYEGYSLEDFLNIYMNSDLKHKIDDRWALHSNMLCKEQLQYFNLVKTGVIDADVALGSWMGEFYARMQRVTGLYSSELIQIMPFKKLRRLYGGAHDHDLTEIMLTIIANTVIICFHNPDEQNGYLSNWYLSQFKYDNVDFSSMKQYMMYMKATLFKDEEVAQEILKTDNVAEIKALGRKVKNFDDKEWDKNKEKIITNGLYAKFSQNNDLKKKLLDTGKAVLAECAVNDKIWGIGLSMKDINRLNTKSWKGQNLLGKCLMTVREKLSNENK